MGKTKILIVEDEAIIAEDLKFMLKSLGYDVIGVAMKYNKAIEILSNTTPDLILLDIILGGAKSGIDLAHEINKNFNIPFIFLTSHADKLTVEQAKATKPLGYLVKPFHKEDIFATLEVAMVQSKSTLSQLLSQLSEREQDVYKALLEGLTDQEIGDKLFISLNTVKTHMKNVFEKLGAKNRLQAVAMANK